jgi:hypothetical protein
VATGSINRPTGHVFRTERVRGQSSPETWCRSSALISSVKAVSGSGRDELCDLLLILVVSESVWLGGRVE